jgi:predicted glycoside hydrolase/deacetylase ChbG (UPF0249 family)
MEKTALLSLLGLALLAPPAPPPAFYRTHDSDAWVRASFVVQDAYTRVLAVDASGHAPGTLEVPALDLNARAPLTATRALRVDQAFTTLQAAVDAAHGGDLIAVLPGRYAGFVMGPKDDAADGRYIHVKALGRPGDVTIDRPGPDPDWMVLFKAAHHAILEGFNIAGHTGPELPPIGPRAGIMLDGDFGRSGLQAHHIALVSNFSHNHRKWGFHSTDTHTVLIQDNLFAFSAEEHSGYASDGSDNYVIRRNVFFGSRASGLQCNIDSVSSLHEVLKHAALRGYPPERPSRSWALGLVRRASALFGVDNFPDGRGTGFIIEDNVINQNGQAGGGSLNLAGLQDSLIQNNLIYGNLNHGIALWDDANPYDAALVDPGPQTASEVEGPDDLPLWGCHTNRIRNNTVLLANPQRAALQFRNGSWGGRARNNILINDGGAALQIFNTSIYRLDSDANVLGRVDDTGMAADLRGLATHQDAAPRSLFDESRASLRGEFVRDGDAPWVVIEGNWWRLNPQRPDFRPRPGSRLSGRGDVPDLPARDLLGRPRSVADIGAFAADVAPVPTPAAKRTLVERLGYPRGAKLVILHGDDMGEWHAVNAASIRALETGAINSGVMMVPCPWFPEIAAWAKAHPGADLGLHLTVTSERTAYRWGPVASRERVPSLLDAQGYLRLLQVEAARAIDAREAEIEIRAQVERALSFGLRPSHLDSHQGVLYQRPDLFEAVARVSRDYGLPIGLARDQLLQFPFMEAALPAAAPVIDNTFDITPDTPPERWADWYEKRIREIGPGVTAIVMHLGLADAELRAGTAERPTWGAEWRQRDFDFFTSERFRRLLADNNLKLVTWRQVAAAAKED